MFTALWKNILATCTSPLGEFFLLWPGSPSLRGRQSGSLNEEGYTDFEVIIGDARAYGFDRSVFAEIFLAE